MIEIVNIISDIVTKQGITSFNGIAYNEAIASGKEERKPGWEEGDLLGYRIDLSPEATEEDVNQIKLIIHDVIQNWESYKESYEASQKLVINSENASKLVKLLVEKGFMTQEEVVTALLADS